MPACAATRRSRARRPGCGIEGRPEAQVSGRSDLWNFGVAWELDALTPSSAEPQRLTTVRSQLIEDRFIESRPVFGPPGAGCANFAKSVTLRMVVGGQAACRSPGVARQSLWLSMVCRGRRRFAHFHLPETLVAGGWELFTSLLRSSYGLSSGGAKDNKFVFARSAMGAQAATCRASC